MGWESDRKISGCVSLTSFQRKKPMILKITACGVDPRARNQTVIGAIMSAARQTVENLVLSLLIMIVRPNELKVLVNSRYSDTSPWVVVKTKNKHTHTWNSGTVTKKASLTTNGVKPILAKAAKQPKQKRYLKHLILS